MRSAHLFLRFWMSVIVAVFARDARGAIADATMSDLLTVRERYVESMFPKSASDIERIHVVAAEHAQTLAVEGTWPDIEYDNHERAQWRAFRHLDRTLVMAKSARLYHNAGHGDSQLDAKVLLALKTWTDRDFQNPNWWWNQIGVPQSLGKITCLMLPQLTDDRQQIAKVTQIMSRCQWEKFTGANLTWGVCIQIVRGCLEQNPQTAAAAYQRMYDEVRVVSSTEEGVQVDGSFHQHGAQLYNGGYGLAYANETGRFVSYAWGTAYQIPGEKFAVLSNYMLDGTQWMVWQDIIDYSTVGREITRRGKVAVPRDWSVGPISPAGPADSLGNMVALLADKPTPRQMDLRAFAARLNRQADASPLVGNRHFWCSDFMVHRRPRYYTSVKMLSNRMLNGELVNDEGKRSQHLSDGANLLYLRGDEYRDIFPLWDWTKIPGTTGVQETLDTGEKNAISARGGSAFAGGVSDGTYGLCAMDLARGKLSARKAWFFFDDHYVCLGNGISLADDAQHRVATAINQTHLVGSVQTDRSAEPLTPGPAVHDQPLKWVQHNDVGYVLLEGGSTRLRVGPQSGAWSEIGTGSDEPLTGDIFSLWIDHGIAPASGGYGYVVLPGASAEQTRQFAVGISNNLEVIANTDAVQAVVDRRLRCISAAFREKSAINTVFGRLAVDSACLILVRFDTMNMLISVADPTNASSVVSVQVGRQHAQISLPDGRVAGSSVTQRIPLP